MTEIVLYLIYLTLIFILFRYFRLEKNSGFGIPVLFFVFLIKCSVGSLNLYIHQQLYITNDITFYYQQSMNELKDAGRHPLIFLNEWLFNWENMGAHLNFFQSENMVYWSTLGTLIHTKLFTLFNVLSFGHIYVDVVLYNILFFLGQLALYKTFLAYSPQKRYLLLGTIFFIPSVLFWCSGMHKDGLVLSVIGGLCRFMYLYFERKKWQYLFFAFLLLVLLTTIRYFYGLCMIPALMIWWASIKTKKSLLTFGLSYSFLLILFFLSPSILKLDTLGLVAHRQQEFFSAKGYSDMETPVLQNTVRSYLENFPSACEHVFMRPLFHSSDPLKYRVASVDSFFIFFLLLTGIFFVKRKQMTEPFILFALFFSLSVLLFIGYTIPNLGALLRYKSAFIAILLPAIFSMTEWKRIKM